MQERSPRRAAAAKPYHHGNLRETLLDAADALLSDRGAAGLTLRDVAKSAGVSHTAPYHHFASLSELLAGVAERAFTTLATEMERAAQADDPQERLVAICESYVAFARRQPAQFRLMFGPMLARKPQHPGLQQAADRAFAVLVRATTALNPGDALLLALTGWSVAHGLANLLIDSAFEGLPVPVPNVESLPREIAIRVLSGGAAPPTAIALSRTKQVVARRSGR